MRSTLYVYVAAAIRQIGVLASLFSTCVLSSSFRQRYATRAHCGGAETGRRGFRVRVEEGK